MALTKIRASSQLLPGSISQSLLDTAFTDRLSGFDTSIATINGDNTVTGSIDNKVKIAIDTLVDGSPDLLNTLNEISAALADDPNFATTITSELALKATIVDLTAETNRAIAVEGLLTNLTTDVQTNLVAAINEVNQDAADNATAISAEASRAGSVEAGLQTQINTNNTKIGTLANLTTETKTSLVQAVNELETNSNANAAAITAETTRATGAETTLQGNIDAEASARATAISTEQTARATAVQGAKDYADSQDALLIGDATVDGTAGNTINDRIASEATARATADTTLQGNIDAEASARATAVSNEASARVAADDALDTRVTANEGSITTLNADSGTVGSVDYKVAAEASARAAAVTAEQTRATTAEGALDTRLTTAEGTIVSNTGRISDIETDTTIIRESDIVTGGTVNGTKDGSNTTFTLPNAARSGTITLYVNGTANFAPANFSVAGDNVTLTLSEAPISTDTVVASYIKAAV